MKRYLLVTIFLLLLIGCGGGGDEPEAVEPTEPAVEETEAGAEEVMEEEMEEEMEEDGETAVYSIGSEADEARTFTIVTDESSASYLVDEEFFADALEKFGIESGEVDVIGTTEDVNGELVLNFGNPDLLESGSFVVNLVSLTTDQNRRDRYIRDNALESNAFPEATFEATAVSGLPDTYTEGEEINFDLTGDLTVRDVTTEVTFDVTAVMEDGRLTGVAELPITMSTFGIDPPDFANTLTVADEFVIQVNFTAAES